ncbi:type III secretion system translocon subunit SctE [Acerihabitans sp. KWT182]|uniref:Type III secretion system translocon subunit SctE n=1 Tax=Acerihabitans sp. KWT182 TaxID=3157919 RepID=A0AAU7QDM2_9GAMM
MIEAISPNDKRPADIETVSAGNNESVSSALFDKTHIPQEKAQSLFNESQKAAEELLSVISSDKGSLVSATPKSNTAAPELKAPQASASAEIKLNSSAMFTLIISTIGSLIGESRITLLTNRLELMHKQSASIKQANEALALQFQQMLEHSAAAIDAANADMELLQLANALLAEKQQNFDEAQNLLHRLSPEDPEYASALSQYESAEKELGEATKQQAVAEGKAMASYQAAYDATVALDDLLKQLKEIPNLASSIIEDMQGQLRNAMAIMILLINSLMKQVSEANEKKLESDREYLQKTLKSEQEAAELSAVKHEEQVSKQKALNTAMGCIGKILGGLITLVSVVGAVFTGGASLAVAAVGLALMAGDAIGKAITGVSFMEKALSPIMENIIKPIVDALSKGIAKMLERLGVDTATANMIGGIVGALVTAALVIAVVIVGKAAGSKLAASALGNIVKEALKDLVPAILKSALTSANAMVRNTVKRVLDRVGLASDKEAMRLYTNSLNKTAISMELGSETIQSAGRVANGAITNDMQKQLASLATSTEITKQINEMLRALPDLLQSSMDLGQKLMAILMSGVEKKRRNRETHPEEFFSLNEEIKDEHKR